MGWVQAPFDKAPVRPHRCVQRTEKQIATLTAIFHHVTMFSPTTRHRSLGNGVSKNGVRNRCPYRRCGVDTEIPYRAPFWREFCWVLPVRVASGVNTEFFRIASVSSIGGLIAATLSADTISDPQTSTSRFESRTNERFPGKRAL